ncbi:MAG: hypothetical protein R6W96_08370 [Clostridia bacterium]
MSYSLDFTPANFMKSLEDIRKKYPLIRETIYADKGRQTESFVQRVGKLDMEHLEDFAARMRNDELELPLVAFRTDIGEEFTEKLDVVLKVRFRKKLFLLNWLILQNNYKNEKLIASMGNLCEIMQEKYPGEYAETIFARIHDWGTDPLDKVMALFQNEKTTLEAFFRKYDFLEKSKFSYDFYTMYFGNADREGITADWSCFIRAAESYVVTQSATVLDRYMGSFEIQDYDKEVTDLVMEKYGPVQEELEFWKLMSDESRTRFEKWTNLKALENHFGRNSKKHLFWSYYANDIQRVELYPESKLAFIYFETRAVVDLGEPEQRAFLYFLETFLIEYEHFKGLPDGEEKAWRIFPEQVVDARSSVIENKKSDIYQFSYEFVGRLYIKEIFKLEAQKKK